ncbi:RNA polymerase II transcription elongation factor SpEAF, partial [Cryomyces antarcticus]
SQMQIAREDARFIEPATPDEQLLAEEREAVRQARDSNHEPEPAPDHEPASESRQEESLTREASNVVQETLDAEQEDLAASTVISNTENLPTEAAEKAGIATPKPLTSEAASPDGDTINVLPRRPPLALDVKSKAEAAKSHDSLLAKATAKSTRLPQSPPSERMTTRVSSGALRHKSVSEILGETPRPPTPRVESLAEGTSLSSPTLGTPATGPFAAPLPLSGNRLRTLDNQAIGKSRLSVANFTEDDNATPLHPFRGEYAALRGASQDGGKDYLHTLFAWQAHQPPRSTALPDILSTAAKTLTTANHFASLRETQDYKILRRIYQLQNANKWSLRQMERCPEPPGSKTHQDFLIAEMKWMRTDFREENKWKTAVARSMAEACAEW